MDNRLKYFYGVATPFKDTCMLYPKRLKDIVADEEAYNNYFATLTLDECDVEKIFKEKGNDYDASLSVYDYYIISCKNSESFSALIAEAISSYVHEEVLVVPEIGFIIGDISKKHIISGRDFLEFQNEIRIMHLKKPIEIPEADEPEFKKQFRLQELKAAHDREIAKKAEGEETIPFEVTLAALCLKDTGITYESSLDLSIYAFNLFQKMLPEKEKYENEVKKLMAGFDPKKIHPKYWIKNYYE